MVLVQLGYVNLVVVVRYYYSESKFDINITDGLINFGVNTSS